MESDRSADHAAHNNDEKGTTTNTCSNVEKSDWDPSGRYSLFLKSRPLASVYFIREKSCVINTLLVQQQSGKGCDASNIHDEELNNHEREFSDDEAERSYKANLKKKRQQSRFADGGLAAAATAATSSWNKCV